MKKVILSVCFIVITLSLSLPAFADSFWNYSGTVNANGFPMKVTVTLTRDVPGGALTIKYSPDHLVFHLNKTDPDSQVDTDIEVLDSVNSLSLTGGMQGGALTVKHTSTVTASFNPSIEADHPFNFNDQIETMTSDELMTSIAEGTLIESFKNNLDQNKAKINMTFRFVGKLDNTNPAQPALITVTLSGTVSKTP
jgi:hypothetical protein